MTSQRCNQQNQTEGHSSGQRTPFPQQIICKGSKYIYKRYERKICRLKDLSTYFNNNNNYETTAEICTWVTKDYYQITTTI